MDYGRSVFVLIDDFLAKVGTLHTQRDDILDLETKLNSNIGFRTIDEIATDGP